MQWMDIEQRFGLAEFSSENNKKTNVDDDVLCYCFFVVADSDGSRGIFAIQCVVGKNENRLRNPYNDRIAPSYKIINQSLT
jgi:hypothetical protein